MLEEMFKLGPCGDVGGVGGLLSMHLLHSPCQHGKGMLTVNMAVSLGQQANLAYCGPVTLLSVSDQHPGCLPWASVWWCHVLLSPSDFSIKWQVGSNCFSSRTLRRHRNSIGMWWGGGGCRAVFCSLLCRPQCSHTEQRGGGISTKQNNLFLQHP